MEGMKIARQRVHDGSGMFAGGGVLGYPSASNNGLDKQTDNLGTQTSNTRGKNEMGSACGLGDMATSGSFPITGTLVPNQTIPLLSCLEPSQPYIFQLHPTRASTYKDRGWVVDCLQVHAEQRASLK